ncbi:uncharacterized protein LOC107264048 isoform X3 [Cephus cinctus]|nr:uncharacterized protein LOC107264048 isoform X3 [Cephus cinctus]
MTTLIFGIGLGLFIVLCLWVSAGLICLVSLRIERRIGAIALCIATAATIILVSLPRSTETPSVREDKLYDHLFVWRIILLILLAVSSLVGFLAYFKFELLEPIKPMRISTWVH